MNFKEYLEEGENHSQISKLFKELQALSYDPYEMDAQPDDDKEMASANIKIEKILLKLADLDSKAFKNAKAYVDSWGQGKEYYKPLVWPRQKLRITKAGVANKQDVKVLKKEIKASIDKLKSKRK